MECKRPHFVFIRKLVNECQGTLACVELLSGWEFLPKWWPAPEPAENSSLVSESEVEELWLRSGVDLARLHASSRRSSATLGRLCRWPLPALTSVDALRKFPASQQS